MAGILLYELPDGLGLPANIDSLNAFLTVTSKPQRQDAKRAKSIQNGC